MWPEGLCRRLIRSLCSARLRKSFFVLTAGFAKLVVLMSFPFIVVGITTLHIGRLVSGSASQLSSPTLDKSSAHLRDVSE